MIRGKKVCLAPIERADLPKLMEWRNIPEFRRYFREYKEINIDMQNNWYQNKVLNDPSTIMFAIRSVESGELLGCCGLCYINWIHRNADLSLYIGWQEAYIDEEGYAKESCQLLFNYGFGELGLEKIWTEIYEFDEKKVHLYNELKFKKDGILRNQYFYENKWWNSYILSLLKSEFLKE